MALISVEHVSKEFRLGELEGIRTAALNLLRRARGRAVSERPRLQALADVSFAVEPGEVLGIIGQNGAGKSTLLKILARITEPSAGRVRIGGQVAPLIEVGAGLVPELTGRENVYLNAAILGCSRRQIARALDDIVAFAELEAFVDTPVKRYSSGMKVRLGFAVATSVEAEILIVDEVLAVGDLAFQRKCFDRMEQLIRREGRTVLLVSHNIRQVERLCSRTILLDAGRILDDGDPRRVCDRFYARSNAKAASTAEELLAGARNVRMTGEIELESVALLDRRGHETGELASGEPVTLRCVFHAARAVEQPEIMFGFHTTDFFYLATMGTGHLPERPDIVPGRNVVECTIPSLPLMPGVFCVRLSILDKHPREMFYGEMLRTFSVRSADVSVTRMPALGVFRIPASWSFAPAAAGANAGQEPARGGAVRGTGT